MYVCVRSARVCAGVYVRACMCVYERESDTFHTGRRHSRIAASYNILVKRSHLVEE